MRAQNKKKVLVRTASIPSPIGGINARDSLADMPETDAVELDNWFPTPTEVVVRNGSKYLAETFSTSINSLMGYNSATVNQLFAVGPNSTGEVAQFTDVTNGGILGATFTATGSSHYQHVNFSTAAGQYLYAVNGEDYAVLYDGANFTSINSGSVPAITGIDTKTFIHVNIYKNRLWFVQKESTKAWYLPVNSVGGAAVSFDIGPLLRLGGYLMGMCTWTLNTASGTDEVAVFVSSEGEVIVYAGYDPSSPSTWAQAGRFRIGRPIGRRFYCSAGADVIMITADGVIALSQAMLTDRDQLRIALSDKIINLINNDVKNYAGNFGWQVILFPIGNKLIINVPQTENIRQYQYVMNTITKAWCTFGKRTSYSAWNANCFETFQDKIYFGDNTGLVFQADVNETDATDFFAPHNVNIFSFAKQAFSYFGLKGQEKYFTMARPILQLEGSIQAAISINVDFDDSVPNVNYALAATGSGSPWDTSPWDTSPWGSSTNIVKDWQTVNGIGFAASMSIAAQTAVQLSWQSTDYVFQPGGIL